MIISYQTLQSFLPFPLTLSPKDLGNCLTQQGLEVERYLTMPSKEYLAIAKIIRVEMDYSVAVHIETQEEIKIDRLLEKDCRYVIDCLDGTWQFSTPARLGWFNQNHLLWIPSGLSLEQAWEPEDTLIELSITPNRGDCLSYVGIAREVAFALKKPFSKQTVLQQLKDRYKVVWEGPTEMTLSIDPELAPNYSVARVYCPTRLQSPFWLHRFLIKHGLAPKMPSVDFSQYLMMLLGHPTHAFDMGSLQEQIHVRTLQAQDDLEITLLDGKKLTIVKDDKIPAILSANSQVCAIPGVIGSLHSAAQADSRDLLLEAAFFEPSVIRSLRKHGIVTQSSLRFERGVDRQGSADVLEIFCGMLRSTHPQVLCWAPQSLQKASLTNERVLSTTKEKIRQTAGTDLVPDQLHAVTDLMGAVWSDNQLTWTVPSWRFDQLLSQNLVAEVLRLYGMNRITTNQNLLCSSKAIVCHDPIVSTWVEKGFQEVVTYSFCSPDWASIGTNFDQCIALKNPLNQDFAIMRPSLWPSLLNVIATNERYGEKRLGVFELAPVYHKNFPLNQKRVVSAVLPQERKQDRWNQSDPFQAEWTYFDVKGLIEQLGFKRSVKWVPLKEKHPFLHPSFAACLVEGDQQRGVVGLIDPALAQHYQWSSAWLIELDAELWESTTIPVFQGLSRFQKVHRRFSFVVPDSVSAETVLTTFKSSVEHCIQARIFDYYRPAVSTQEVTLGIESVFQHPHKTLEDADLNPMIDSMLSTLKEKLGVVLKYEKHQEQKTSDENQHA